MRGFFTIFALVAAATAQRNSRTYGPSRDTSGGPRGLVTLTATEVVTVTSCPPVTTVCNGQTTVIGGSSSATATASASASTTLTTSTSKGSSTASPTSTATCFRLQARSPANRIINNSFLDSASSSTVGFTRFPTSAGLYTLDSSSQLRNARSGAFASRALVPRTSYGPVWMSGAGTRSTDDKVTCSVDKGALKCTAGEGSLLLASGNSLYIAKDANVPRGMQPVDFFVWTDKCPAGMPKM